MSLKSLLTDKFFPERLKESGPQIERPFGRGKQVLDAEQRRFFIMLMGQYMNATEITEEMRKKYELVLNPKNVMIWMGNYKKAKKWIPILERIRHEYANNLHEVGGSFKRVRMDRRERLYELSLKKGEVRNALIAVKHMEEEMEGSRHQNSINLTLNQYNTMSDQELDERRQELLDKIQPKIIDVKKEN